jgi:hypothetical protein
MKLLRKYFVFILIYHFAKQEASLPNSRFPGLMHDPALAKSADFPAYRKHSATRQIIPAYFFAMTHLQIMPSRPFRRSP